MRLYRTGEVAKKLGVWRWIKAGKRYIGKEFAIPESEVLRLLEKFPLRQGFGQRPEGLGR